MTQVTATYNKATKIINNDLLTIKRCGASYETILNKIRPLITKFNDQLYHFNNQKNELLKNKEGLDNYMLRAKTNKQLREEKIKKYDERINQFSNAAKSVLASMNFKNLKKVKQEPNIRDLYRFFFINLYHEVPEDYNFDDFCKIALDKDINDFQKRLAKFSIYKLSKESRERIQNLRERDYSLNTTNDDFNFLLEWLDYNFEAYLSFKEKISEENTLKEINKKESVKTIQSNAANKMVQDLDGLVTYLEESLRHLNLYEKKLSEAERLYKNGGQYREINKRAQNLFDNVDSYQGNDQIIELNQKLNAV